MDRQSVLGFVLIFVVLMVWMYLNQPQPKPQPVHPAGDTTQVEKSRQPNQAAAVQQGGTTAQTAQPAQPYGKFFTGREQGEEKIVAVETDKFYAEFTSRGGLVRKWIVKGYNTWDTLPVQLVEFDKKGDFSLLFQTSDGKLINTRDFYFDVNAPNWKHIRLQGDQKDSIDFVLPVNGGGTIVKRFVFNNNEYGFDANIAFLNCASVIPTRYDVIWEHGLRYVERNSFGEAQVAYGYAYGADELIEVDAPNFDEKASRQLEGNVKWIASRNKYFALAIIPEAGKVAGASIEGVRERHPDNGAREVYSTSMSMAFDGTNLEQSRFKVFLGPMQHDVLKSYKIGLEKMMNLGWAWIIRPIAEYILLPVFMLLHLGIPNWGLVIVIFSLLIKIALHPLSKSQMQSMKKMQKLQPLMEELRQKYADDPQKMNTATMQLYKDYGVNPAGGCLPVLLQMPILFGLYSVLSGAIELRQAAFAFWIHDLSVPDAIVTLPFHVPFFGFNEVSGLSLIMGITMFFSSKQTTTDPRQKSMIYIMPIMFTFIFNSLPSGLNLYYLVFNILSIGQQAYINRVHKDEPLVKVEQKKTSRGGIFGKLPSTRDLQKLAEKKRK